jgi:hypothetical protein
LGRSKIAGINQMVVKLLLCDKYKHCYSAWEHNICYICTVSGGVLIMVT